jgi:hypothetical protein
MLYLAFGETVRAPSAMPLSAPAADKGEGPGESVAELASEVCFPVILAPADWDVLVISKLFGGLAAV